MPNEPENSDAYAIVLRDLRAQRDRIDAAIAAIESLYGAAPERATLAAAPVSASAPNNGLGAGAFLGLTIVDAAKKLLAHERRQLNNAEIVELLKRGGLVLNSVDQLNTVGSVLNRRFIQVGDIVRVGRGTWGLKEWYPNRSFKAPAKADALRETVEELLGGVPAAATLQGDDGGASVSLDALRDEEF